MSDELRKKYLESIRSVSKVPLPTLEFRQNGNAAKRQARRQKVFDRDGNKCLRCGSEEDLTIDHEIPTSLGGKDFDGNKQTLCQPCNVWKGSSGKFDYRPKKDINETIDDVFAFRAQDREIGKRKLKEHLAKLQ